MMRSLFRYLVFFLFSIAFILVLNLMTEASDSIEDETSFSYGCDISTDEELASYDLIVNCNEQNNYVRNSLPVSVDLSSSLYFPPIQNQGSNPSCAAFACGYYQFTYERNRVKGVTSDTSSTWASPAWIYRMYSAGHHSSETVYDILKNYGPLSWLEDAYNLDDNNVLARNTFPNNSSAMIREMEYRIVEIERYDIDSTGTPITSVDSAPIVQIKTQLAEGYTLSVSTLARNWVSITRDDNVLVTVRGGNRMDELNGNGGGHAVLVVGYDDEFYFDLDNDGYQDLGEFGALKVVNSWGTNSGNSGYYWMMYDSLNAVSSVSGNIYDNYKVDEYGSRIGIFTREYSGEDRFKFNYFRKIIVEKTNCDFMLQLSLNGQHLNWLSIKEQGKLERQDSTTLLTTSIKDLYVMPYVDDTLTYSGEWVIDLSVMEQSSMILDSTINYVDYTIVGQLGIKDPDSGDATRPKFSYLNELMSSISYKIIDSTGTALSSLRTRTLASSTNAYLNSIIYLDERGDVNCDGTANAQDALMVLNAASKKIELTNLQAYYGDYNMDGLVNAVDANLILQDAAGMTAEEASAQINALLNQINQTY